MTQRDKLVRRFLAEPPEVDLEDVVRLLEMFGYDLRRTGGSHNAFVATGKSTIVVPVVRGRKVKRAYVRMINRVLDLEGYLEDER